MPDNSILTAAVIVSGAGFAGDSVVYERTVQIVAHAIRATRDEVFTELVVLRDSFAEDDLPGETYYLAAIKRLTEKWGTDDN